MRQSTIQDTLQAASGLASGPASGPTTDLGGFLNTSPLLETAAWVCGILVVAWLANTLTRRYILKVISRVVTRTKFTWDDVIFERKVFRRLAHVAPALSGRGQDRDRVSRDRVRPEHRERADDGILGRGARPAAGGGCPKTCWSPGRKRR